MFKLVNLYISNMIIFICFVFSLLSIEIGANEEFDGMMTLSLHHSLELDPEAQFVPRGTISIKSIRSGIAIYNPETASLSQVDRNKLKELARNDVYYKIKVSTKPIGEDSQWVSTFMRACSLVESSLSEIITLHVDQSGDVVGISSMCHTVCEGALVPDSHLMHFNTSVLIHQMESGPIPDTASYIQKVEKEKAEKAKGDQAENKSFLGKYWMYIVPFLIFLVISSAASPDAQVGGGR